LADFNAKANGKWRMRCIRHRLCHFACEMANRTRRHKASVVCNIDLRFRAHPPTSS
jgi:hypothetical protein